MARYFDEAVDTSWSSTRSRMLEVLQRDVELREVANVVGPEALEDKDRLLLAAAAALRESVLGQSAFDPNDAFSPPAKTIALAGAALRAFDTGNQALADGASFAELSFDGIHRALANFRDAAPDDRERARQQIEQAIAAISVASALSREGQRG